MAKETLDKAVSVCSLPAKGESGTDGLLLEGAHTWTPTMFIRLVQDYGVDSQVGGFLTPRSGGRQKGSKKKINYLVDLY